MHLCEHVCTNTDGSYVCSCNSGFFLAINGFSCTSMYTARHGTRTSQQGNYANPAFLLLFLLLPLPLPLLPSPSPSLSSPPPPPPPLPNSLTSSSTIDTDITSCSSLTDIDECSMGMAMCVHNCTDTHGSYTCSCQPGYTLGADGYSCVGKAHCIDSHLFITAMEASDG